MKYQLNIFFFTIQYSLICPNKIGPYQLLRTIGSGAYGVVKLALKINTKQYFACKVIAKQRIEMMSDKTRFEQEIRVQQQMRNENIVQLIDLYQDSLNFYIIIEFCPKIEKK